MSDRPTTWHGVAIPYDASIDALQAMILGPAPQRWAAFRALACVPGTAALAVLRQSADSTDPYVRRSALESIGRHPEGTALAAAICKALADPDAHVVRAACNAAAQLSIHAAHDALVQLVRAPSAEVRSTAVRCVGILWKDHDFEAIFAQLIADRSKRVQKESAWVLREHASVSTWRALFDIWRDAELPRYRVWACELARTFGGDEQTEALARLSNDRDGHVRRAAHEALERVKEAG